MCTTWLINGKYCENGRDLIDAVGIESARRVNTSYDSIGAMLWTTRDGKRVDFPCTHETVAESCLCHVDSGLMATLTGGAWGYDPEGDIMCMVPLDRKNRVD